MIRTPGVQAHPGSQRGLTAQEPRHVASDIQPWFRSRTVARRAPKSGRGRAAKVITIFQRHRGESSLRRSERRYVGTPDVGDK